jgi:hypothetical protein
VESPCTNSIFYLFSMLTLLQGQSQPLNFSCVFRFGSSLSESQAAINEPSQIIWRKGGFRFRTNRNPRRHIFCSQDKDRARQKPSRRLRDAPQMERFSCSGYLTFALIAPLQLHCGIHTISHMIITSFLRLYTIMRPLKYSVTYKQCGLRGGIRFTANGIRLIQRSGDAILIPSFRHKACFPRVPIFVIQLCCGQRAWIGFLH